MPQERVGQVRGAPDALDTAVGLLNDLSQGQPGEVASSTAFL